MSAGLDFLGSQGRSLIGQQVSHLFGLLSTPQPRASMRASASDVATVIKAFAMNLAFTLDVPGRHYSGLSNNQLLAIMAEQGRNFGARTRQLDEHVRQQLLARFVDGGAIPSLGEMKATASDAIIEWIVMRFEGSAHDVQLSALTSKYRAFKQRNGLSSRIGVATGELMETIRDSGVAHL